MKTISIIILVIVFSHATRAQDQNLDSAMYEFNMNKFFFREFSSLSQDDQLASLEKNLGGPINSLASCLVIFRTVKLNQVELASMTTRLEEIAMILHDEGTPIYLCLGGMNSMEWTTEKNKKGYQGNLRFVSTGNYCIIAKGELQMEDIFNKKTLELLGIKNLD